MATIYLCVDATHTHDLSQTMKSRGRQCYDLVKKIFLKMLLTSRIIFKKALSMYRLKLQWKNLNNNNTVICNVFAFYSKRTISLLMC